MAQRASKEPEKEQEEVQQASSAHDIHKAIFQEAEDELDRSTDSLFWSGLAAGLSMGFSMIGHGLLKTYLPKAEWTTLVVSFGYSLGFVIVILGRQQLFTENTLTPMLPLLERKDFKTFWQVMRLWGVVLLANLTGALLLAFVIAKTTAFSPAVLKSFEEIGYTVMEPNFSTTLVRGIFAGWLIALMVWILPNAQNARLWIIILITYIISVAHFSHVIAGAVETFTLAAMQKVAWSDVLGGFILPALIGNIIGGVILVAVINHAQVKGSKK